MKLDFNFWPSWFVIMLSLGSMKPKVAWLLALVIGGSVFLFNVFRNNNFQSILALVFAFIGAYAGAGLSKIFAKKTA